MIFSLFWYDHALAVGGLIEERSGKFEGDLLLSERQRNVIRGVNNRNGLTNLAMRWTNKVIPVLRTSNHTKEQNDLIDKALRTLESVSCVKFVWRTNEKDFISMHVSCEF